MSPENSSEINVKIKVNDRILSTYDLIVNGKTCVRDVKYEYIEKWYPDYVELINDSFDLGKSDE